MRIALVVERFDQSGGGVEHAVWQLARCFRAHGDEVHVIAREGVEEEGVVLHQVPVSALWQPWRVWQFSKRVSRLIARSDYDVVHGFAHTESQDIFHAGGGSHAAYMRHGYGRMGGWIRQLSPRHRIRLHLERLIVRDERQLIQCTSQMVLKEFAELYAPKSERLFVVPCGVDLDRFSPQEESPDRVALRREWGGDVGTIWLFPGSGFKRKGLDTALAALAQCKDKNAQLWVAGRDRWKSWARRARTLGVRHRVHFLGHRTDMERLYAAADGVILPTRYDGWGMVCLEAAASARPLITSAKCGASEWLSDVACVVPQADDAAGFAAGLDRFSDAGARSVAGKGGRRIAESHGWDVGASALRCEYERVIARRASLQP